MSVEYYDLKYCWQYPVMLVVFKMSTSIDLRVLETVQEWQ